MQAFSVKSNIVFNTVTVFELQALFCSLPGHTTSSSNTEIRFYLALNLTIQRVEEEVA